MILQPLTLNVLEFIRTHPECSFPDIRAALEPVDSTALARALQRLRRSSLIKNANGKGGRGAVWVAVNPPKAHTTYRKTAKSLLEELKGVHPSQREAHLAARLEELFD